MKHLIVAFVFLVVLLNISKSLASSPPQNFSAMASGNSVSFSWSPPPASGVCEGESCTFKEYRLQKIGEGNFTFVSANRTTTTFTVHGVSNGQHSYILRAYYDIGTDYFPNYDSSTVIVNVGVSSPPTPSSITASLNGKIINISWAPSAGAVSYELQRNDTTTVVTTASTSYADSSATAGSWNRYRVNACNAAGCSAWTGNTEALRIPPIPNVPGSFTVNVVGVSVRLGWVSLDNPGYYEVRRNNVVIATVTTSGYDDSAVTPGVTYNYQVNACSASGCSGSTQPLLGGLPARSSSSSIRSSSSSVISSSIRSSSSSLSSSMRSSSSIISSSSRNSSSSLSSLRSSSSISSRSSSSFYSSISWDKSAIDPLDDSFASDAVYAGDFSGEFSVDANGAFNYSIPLQIAPGINGMQPDLAMQYNSNVKNGLLGFGWNITETNASIARCHSDLVRDGKRSGVGDQDDFKYCLNGGRLVEVSSGEFRLESDPTKKIIIHGVYRNPLGWSVYQADGKIYEYGNSVDSIFNGSEYFLKKKKDRSGNYVEYTYDNNTVKNTIKLLSIAYTKSEIGLQGLNNEIIFSYESRQDPLTYYRGGYRQQITDRLNRITIKVNSEEIRYYLLKYDTWDGVNYADPTKTSRITKISKCDAGEYCPEIEFKWNDLNKEKYKISNEVSDYSLSQFDDIDNQKQISDSNTVTYQQPVETPPLGEVFLQEDYSNKYLRGDFDGDNKKEIIWWDCKILPNCTYYVQMSKSDPVQIIDRVQYHSHLATTDIPGVTQNFIYEDRFNGKVADINGDGLDDFYLVSGLSGIKVYISNGSALVFSSSYSIDANKLRKYVPQKSLSLWGFYKTLIDVTGDGLPDLIKIPAVNERKENIDSIFTLLNENGIYVAVNTGSGFSEFSRWGTMSDYQTSMKSPFFVGNSVIGADSLKLASAVARFGDVNGDGLVDIIGYLPDVGVEVGINTGSSFVYKNNWANWSAPKIAHSPQSNYGSWYTCPFNGQLWEEYPIYHYAHESFRYGDVNGDGLTDIVFLTDAGVYASLSTGSSYASPTLWSNKLTLKQAICGTSISSFRGYWHRWGKANWELVDFNKDGRSDIGVTITNTVDNGSQNHWDILFSSGAENSPGLFSDPVRVYTNSWDINTPYAMNQIGVSENGDSFIVKGRKATSDRTYPHVNYDKEHYEAIVDRGMYRIPFDAHEIQKVISKNGSSSYQIDITYKNLNRNTSIYKESTSNSLKSYSLSKIPLVYVDTDVAGNSSSYYDATKTAFIPKNRAVSLLKVNLNNIQQHEIEYKYENYRSDKRGWGGLGFQKIESTTRYAERALVSSVEYLQEITSKYALTKPKSISVTAVQLQTSNADSYRQLISQERYTYKIRSLNDDIDSYKSPRYFSYIWSAETKRYDFDSGAFLGVGLLTNYNNSVTNSCPQYSEVDTAQRIDSSGYYVDEFGTVYDSINLQCNNFGVVGKRVQNTNIQNNKPEWLIGLVKDPYNYSWVYDAPSAQTDSVTRRTSFTFDEKGRVKTEIREPDLAADKKITTTREYNQYGSISEITESVSDFSNDGIEFTSRTVKKRESYSTRGARYLETENALGHIIAQSFEPRFGLEESVEDQNGLITSYAYDRAGRLTEINRPDNTKTSINYRVCSGCFEFNLSAAWYKQVKETGKTSNRFYYDGINREVGGRTRGLTGEFNFYLKEYRSDGLPLAESQPFRSSASIYKTAHYYDGAGREVLTEFPNSGLQSIDYNFDQNVEAVTVKDSLGNKKSQQFDAAGREKIVVDSLGSITTYTYDGLGNVNAIQIKGKNGESPISHSIKYDVLGRKIELHDPDVGRIDYSYNAFGHLVSQKNAENETVRYGYDKLDRQIKRVDPPSTTDLQSRTHLWSFDNKPNGIGLLGGVTGFDTQGRNFSEQYSYSNYGLLTDTDFLIDIKNYRISNVYDNFSRSIGLVYPTGFAVGYSYNSYGFNDKVMNARSKQNLWSAANDNAYGSITNFSFGNGVLTQKAFSPNTGLIDTIKATKGGETIQDHDYDFDSEGNLRKRQDKRFSIVQNFCYDPLYRLTSNLINQTCNDVINGNYASARYAYNIHGNIIKKDNISDYRYGENAGPHAVTFANGKSYQYDKAGRMKGGTGRVIEYSAFGKPVYLSRDTYQTQIVYGPLEKRVRRMDIESGALTTTTYINKLYEKIESPTGVEHRHYVSDFGIYVVDDAAQQSYNVYQHFDHIGSIAAKTDDRPSSTTKLLANEPWGQRQDKSWNGQIYPHLTGAALKEITFGTTRGFTGHEHLDAVGLIHMNGRVYDPVLGRFISPDPWIQDPKNSQSFNRYSYVWNNPLKYTDPTGEQTVCESIACPGGSNGEVSRYRDGKKESSEGGIEFDADKYADEGIKQVGFVGVDTYLIGLIDSVNEFIKDPSLPSGLMAVASAIPGGQGMKVVKNGDEAVDATKGIDKAADDLSAVTPDVNTPLDAKIDVDAPVLNNAVEQVVEKDKFGNVINRNARTVQDQLALEAAMRGEGAMLIENLSDPKYLGMEKWGYEVISSGNKKTDVHYVRDPKTGQLMDFKFKASSADYIHKYEKEREGGKK